MNRAFLAAVLCLSAAGGFALAAGWCPPDHVRYWRISGSYDYLTGTDAGDLLNNGWNIELERSIVELSRGDLSANVGYRSVDGNLYNIPNSCQTYSAGFKWRLGPGAMPNNEGYYYGFGVGIAVLTSDLLGHKDTATQFEGRALAGVNFAKCWLVEVDYNVPGSVQGVQMTNIGFSLGYRF